MYKGVHTLSSLFVKWNLGVQKQKPMGICKKALLSLPMVHSFLGHSKQR